MRVILLAAAFLSLASCASPRRAILAPSAAPVRNRIEAAQSHAAKAKAAIAVSDLALATHEVDALTHELINAQDALNTFEQQTAELAAQAEKDRQRLAAAEAQAKKNAKIRNRFALIALAFAAFVFREPLLKLCGGLFRLARIALGIPI